MDPLHPATKDRVVAIVFCGGCKPEINRGALAQAIHDTLVGQGFAVTYNNWEAAFVVRLSGCTVDCVSRYQPSEHPGAVVAGRSFDAVTADEASLPDLVIDAVARHFAAARDSTPEQVAGVRLGRRPDRPAGRAGHSGDGEK